MIVCYIYYDKLFSTRCFMKIINTNANLALASTNKNYRCAGFVTGPIRAIGGVAQVALNGVATIFSALPSAIGCFKKDSELHAYNLLRDAGVGLLHIFRGMIEFLPGSFLCLDMVGDGRDKKLVSDNPFSPFYIDDIDIC
jgi:hypothetical protein